MFVYWKLYSPLKIKYGVFSYYYCSVNLFQLLFHLWVNIFSDYVTFHRPNECNT